MSGPCAGRVQLWGASDRVIRAAGGKARSRALRACSEALPAWRGTSPFPASLPLMEQLPGAGLLREITHRPCSLQADSLRRKATGVIMVMSVPPKGCTSWISSQQVATNSVAQNNRNVFPHSLGDGESKISIAGSKSGCGQCHASSVGPGGKPSLASASAPWLVAAPLQPVSRVLFCVPLPLP